MSVESSWIILLSVKLVNYIVYNHQYFLDDDGMKKEKLTHHIANLVLRVNNWFKCSYGVFAICDIHSYDVNEQFKEYRNNKITSQFKFHRAFAKYDRQQCSYSLSQSKLRTQSLYIIKMKQYKHILWDSYLLYKATCQSIPRLPHINSLHWSRVTHIRVN